MLGVVLVILIQRKRGAAAWGNRSREIGAARRESGVRLVQDRKDRAHDIATMTGVPLSELSLYRPGHPKREGTAL